MNDFHPHDEIIQRWLDGELIEGSAEWQELPKEALEKMKTLRRTQESLNRGAKFEQDILNLVTRSEPLSQEIEQVRSQWMNIQSAVPKQGERTEAKAHRQFSEKRWRSFALPLLALAAGVLLILWGSGWGKDPQKDSEWTPQGTYLSGEASPTLVTPLGDIGLQESYEFRWEGSLPADCTYRLLILDANESGESARPIVDESDLMVNQYRFEGRLPSRFSWRVVIESYDKTTALPSDEGRVRILE